MGSAGDSPAPVGDPPTGTPDRHLVKRPCPLARTAVPVPSGESPDGTGGSPVLPENEFSDRLLAPVPKSAVATVSLVRERPRVGRHDRERGRFARRGDLVLGLAEVLRECAEFRRLHEETSACVEKELRILGVRKGCEQKGNCRERNESWFPEGIAQSNPKGIPAHSPRLRGTSYLGNRD